MANDWLKKLLWSAGISVGLIFALLVVMGGLTAGPEPPEIDKKNITLGKCDFKVTEAVTDEEKARGLMGVKNLASDQIMTFPFDKSSVQTFWMKNMLMPIDLIWLDNKKVIGWEENMLPDNGQRVYQSPGPANLVVEAAAGTIKRCEIEINTDIRF